MFKATTQKTTERTTRRTTFGASLKIALVAGVMAMAAPGAGNAESGAEKQVRDVAAQVEQVELQGFNTVRQMKQRQRTPMTGALRVEGKVIQRVHRTQGVPRALNARQMKAVRKSMKRRIEHAMRKLHRVRVNKARGHKT